MIAAPPPSIPTRVPVSSTGGFSWIGLTIFLVLLAWLGVQLLPAGRRKWRSRWGLLAPLLSVVAGDIHAVFIRPFQIRFKAWQFRQDLDKGDS